MFSNTGAAGHPDYRLHPFGLVDEVQQKFVDTLAIRTDFQDLQFPRPSSREAISSAAASSATCLRPPLMDSAVQVSHPATRIFIRTHHLLDLGERLSFPDYHNFFP